MCWQRPRPMVTPIGRRQTFSHYSLNKLKHSKTSKTSKIYNSELQPGFAITLVSGLPCCMHTRLTVTYGLFNSSAPLHHWKHCFTIGKKTIWTSHSKVKLREIWNSIKTVMYRQLLFHANKAIHKYTGFRGRQALLLHSIHSFQLLALETFFGKSFMNHV